MDLARVLLVDDDLTSRLTLQTVLEAGGYQVDAAASAAEAIEKLDHQEYELVLSDLRIDAPQTGLSVLAYARMLEYRPATAIVTTYRDSRGRSRAGSSTVLIAPEDLPGLLSRVADLISERATRKVERELRHSGVAV